MALSSGAQVLEFEGSPVSAVSLTADLADGGVGGGSAAWSNTDGAEHARAVLHLPNGCTDGAWNTAPIVSLYGRKQDVDGTSDETPEPSSADTVGAHPLGSFALDDHATPGTEQRIALMIFAEGCAWEFWIENDTGRSLDYVSTAITVKVEGAAKILKA